MKRIIRFVSCCFLAACSFLAFSAETDATQGNTLEVNNNWSVRISNSLQLSTPLYVAIRKVGNHWEIAEIFEQPPKIKRSQDLELFMATRDFQQWTNFYNDLRSDCERFEVKESEFHSVCTSSFAGRKMGIGIAGALFGNRGAIPFAYTDEKVKEAINSIRPQQAMVMLDAFEKSSLNAKKEAQFIAANQQQTIRQYEEAKIAARKSAPIGAKDWCEQTVKYIGIVMQIEPNYTCQTYGVVTEDNLRNEGWAIINKKERKVGYAQQNATVHDIAIEKVPR